MAELNEYVALVISDEEVSLYDVLRLAKLNGQVQFVQDAIDAALIRRAAEQRRIQVSDGELQKAADDFRVSRELHDAEATEAWLEVNHLSYTDWEALLEGQIIARKLREVLTAGRVEQYFAEQRLSFDAAAISRLVLSDEGVARELRAQIIEDGADFHVLAREYSVDAATKLSGGYAGLVRRSDIEAVEEAAVFGAKPGVIAGPFKTDDGWELIKIESIHPAVLDDSLRETIKAQLFSEWLSDQRHKTRISIPMLEASLAAEESEELDEESQPVGG